MDTTTTKPTGFSKTGGSNEAYEKMSAAATEAADLIKTSSSTTLSGLQEYNNKFLEFAQANTTAAYDFVQKLHGVKSPSEFMEISTQYARTQTEALTEQTKQLAYRAQKIALATAEPLKAGVAKAFNRAR